MPPTVGVETPDVLPLRADFVMLFTVGNDIDFALLVVIFGACGTLLILSRPVLKLIVESFFCLLDDLLPELFLLEDDLPELLEPLPLGVYPLPRVPPTGEFIFFPSRYAVESSKLPSAACSSK